MLRHISLTVICVLAVSACATSISFQSAKLEGFSSPPEEVRGVLAKPSGKGPFPAVVLLHTCGGVLPHVSEDWPAFLTGNGYATLTVDTFGSRNAGRCPEAFYLGGLTMWRDAYGALDFLASRPDIISNRIGVMGFSLGASAIESIAVQKIQSPGGRNFSAGVAVYGGCSILQEPSFPVLEIIGDKDRGVYSCADRAVPRLSVEIIPGAYHAFDHPQLSHLRTVSGNHPSVYDWSATIKARKLTRDFFAKHLDK